MSFSLASFGTVGAFAANQTISALLVPQRAIGIYMPNVVVSEDHEDTLNITRQPVEKSADITDHAYKDPPGVTIRCGWSDASLGALASLVTGGINGTLSLSDALGVLTDGLGGQSYAAQMFRKIIALQESVTPVKVVTGKRTYPTMLLANVTVHTDSHSEYALIMSVRCQSIILVSTATTKLPPNANQSAAQTTASPQNTGTQAPSTTNNQSILLQGANAGQSFIGSLVGGF